MKFLLIASHITLEHCNNFNPATLLPSETDKALHDCLTLTDHMTPHDHLQETALSEKDFSWLIDGSYFLNVLVI